VELERDALLGKAHQGGGAEGHGGTGLEQGSALDHGDVLLEDGLERMLGKDHARVRVLDGRSLQVKPAKPGLMKSIEI
jgi:hypothetical protein